MSDGLDVYNHTPHVVPFYLPDPSHGQSQGLNWSGNLDLYVKCQDRNGMENPNFYKVSMCINQGPDNSPPIITATFPETNSLISFDSQIEEVRFITNEFSTCRWSDNDTDYSLMDNQLDCDDEFAEPSSTLGYVCTTNITLTGTTTTKYLRCKDQPWYEGTLNETLRNSNTQSFNYILNKPIQKITIDSISPSTDFKTASDQESVDLEVKTIGGGNTHICSYSFSGYDQMIQLFETGQGDTHNQPLNLYPTEHKIFIECQDETGDTSRLTTEFEIIKDEKNARITRIWQDDSEIIFLTGESAVCKYSEKICNFNWENGTTTGTGRTHIIDAIIGRTYNIKCLDDFGNRPSGCTAKIRAS
jgi:hypothetical protein